MDTSIIIPLLFWLGIIGFGIILWQIYKKKNKNIDFFEFQGYKKIIYYLGWLNMLNLIFWLVILIYWNRYKTLPRKERHKKLAYVVYYFGYVSIVFIIFLLIIESIY